MNSLVSLEFNPRLETGDIKLSCSVRNREAVERFGHFPRRRPRLILCLPRKRLGINQQPEIRDSAGFGLLFGRFSEDIVHDDDGRYALSFQPYSVPHGAAGAGPSGANPCNHQVGPRETGNFTLRCSGRKCVFLTQRDYVLRPVKLGQLIFETHPKFDGRNVAVEEQAKPLPLKLLNSNWAAKSFAMG